MPHSRSLRAAVHLVRFLLAGAHLKFTIACAAIVAWTAISVCATLTILAFHGVFTSMIAVVLAQGFVSIPATAFLAAWATEDIWFKRKRKWMKQADRRIEEARRCRG